LPSPWRARLASKIGPGKAIYFHEIDAGAEIFSMFVKNMASRLCRQPRRPLIISPVGFPRPIDSKKFIIDIAGATCRMLLFVPC
jgi:hypothetical protein